METNENRRERAIAVGLSVSSSRLDIYSDDDTLAELSSLIETAGGEVVGTAIQNRQTPDPATFIGEGKALEIADSAKELSADMVVFDSELSPVQMKNLERIFALPVLDRTGVILDIFASRARTAEGKLQVELAQYKYLLPRLIGQGKSLSRQAASGGPSPIGTRGPGETKLETDRRHIKARITKLERDLGDVVRIRGEQRKSRMKSGLPLAALVGYTNAGKSTLLNALTGAEIQTGDRLFDTLDPTTRTLDLGEKKQVLLTDTVGFIDKLPHQLVKAFRATLLELADADLVIHVVDASSGRSHEQRLVADKLIDEICAPGTPRIYVYNKADLCGDLLGGGRDSACEAALPEGGDFSESSGRIAVSALTGENLKALKELIGRAAGLETREFRAELPYSRAALLERYYRETAVENAEYTEDAVVITGRGSAAALARLEKLTSRDG